MIVYSGELRQPLSEGEIWDIQINKYIYIYIYIYLQFFTHIEINIYIYTFVYTYAYDILNIYKIWSWHQHTQFRDLLQSKFPDGEVHPTVIWQRTVTLVPF